MRTREGANTAMGDLSQLAAALRAAGFRGEVSIDPAERAAVSTDNSVYQIVPQAVVAPSDEDDVVRLVRVLSSAPLEGTAITARGGGTGTNAQSLNTGVTVDFRRHMNRVLAVNAAEGWAEVEPGVVLDDLNDQLVSSGLFFAPNTSTASRCTIGGMVSTDASGKGSRVYGKTGDNLFGLNAVVGNGLLLDGISGAATPDDLTTRLALACDEGRASLLEHVPDLVRRFSGYDLERARPDPARLEWWRLLVGAEGTLGLITRIRVRLVRRPRHHRLVIIGFESFASAADAAQPILAFDPLAIECLDEKVQRLAIEAGLLVDLPAGAAALIVGQPVCVYVEFAGNDEAGVAAAAAALVAVCDGLAGQRGCYVTADPAEMKRLWAVRSDSVGLLGRSASRRVPVPFIEDCVVPPARLGGFVREFQSLLESEGLDYGIYGHADVGCIHVRPALDIDAPGDRDRLKSLSDAVYALVQRYRGIFWGEHGKGVRGEYLRDYVGDTAYRAFQQVKQALDPGERFNPGKLVVLDAVPTRILTTPFRLPRPEPDDGYERAFACNGNAACLSHARTVAMCPSFKATGNVAHSPKGRSEALKAWHAARRAGSPDIAELEQSAFRVLDGCLDCKSCASSCPVNVDIPAMKSMFLESYYAHRPRPAGALLIVALERWARTLARLRPFVLPVQSVGLVPAVARLFGLVDAPRFSRRGVGRLGFSVLRPADVKSRALSAETVLVAADAYTSLFDTGAVAEVCAGLASLGYDPVIIDLPPGGKAAHVKGDLRSFERQARRLKAALDPLADAELPIVGVDPAFVLMLRSEYARAGLAPRARVAMVQEFLAGEVDNGRTWPQRTATGTDATIFLHCTERTASPAAASDWTKVFAAAGMQVSVAQTGCCGMSGAFGHEQRHQEVSRRLFELSWQAYVDGKSQVHATGFSCRCQVERLSSARASHPLALLGASAGGQRDA